MLNTPKLLNPAAVIAEDPANRRLSRRLFGNNDSITGNIAPPAAAGAQKLAKLKGCSRIIGLKKGGGPKSGKEWARHPAPTSQVNEYENISPTPSTDL